MTLDRSDSNDGYLRRHSFIHSFTCSFIPSGESDRVSGNMVALGM